jgi:16S rRNA (cytosine1402-N4)-methyltransferase
VSSYPTHSLPHGAVDLTAYHEPVLLDVVLQAAEGVTRVVDCTVGDGGHAVALAARPGTEILGIDRDPEAIATARARLGPRATLLTACYSDREALDAVRAFGPDFILLDLGVSSRQLDQEARGFTFRAGAELDMRMGTEGVTAAELLNEWPLGDLERVLAEYADERRARRLAREIVRRRTRHSFATSDDLVNAIRAVLGPRSGPGDFARIFQGVRIAVNDELAGLARALPELRDALVGGCLAVISYHSGEDRVVKHTFREWARACVCPPHQPLCTCRGRALGRLTPRKPIMPADSEIEANPRARSARLRIFQVSKHEA